MPSYSKPTLSGFNASPPADDGSAVESNRVYWATILDKQGTPLQNFSNAINDAMETTIGAMGTAADVNTGNSSTTVHLGGLLQRVVATPYTTAATHTVTIPVDDTIPQNTEGTELLTATITPNNTAHRLMITSLIHGAQVGTSAWSVALFQDSTADAIAAAINSDGVADNTMGVYLRHEMAAGTTSATTFKIRVGASSGNWNSNSNSSSRKFGGILACTLVVEEYV